MKRTSLVSYLSKVLAGALILAGTVSSQAEVQISTLGYTQAGGKLTVKEEQGGGFSFITGAHDEGYFLNSITIRMGEVDVQPPPQGTLQAFLFALGDNFLPSGSALTSFSYGAFTNDFAPVVFTPNSAITLAPNKGYAIVLLSDDAGLAQWSVALAAYSSEFSPTGTDWSQPNGIPYTVDHGETYTLPVNQTLMASVDASAVPEPATYLMILGGLAFVLIFKRKPRTS